MCAEKVSSGGQWSRGEKDDRGRASLTLILIKENLAWVGRREEYGSNPTPKDFSEKNNICEFPAGYLSRARYSR